MPIRRRALSFALLGLLGGAAFFFLYAPAPDLPTGAVREDRLELEGRPRRYLVHVPAGAPTPAPVLLVFHPSQSSSAAMRGIVGPLLEKIAAREGLIVVYPDGFEGHWNDCRRVAGYSARRLRIDDVGFMRAILGRLAEADGADPSRVYALGFSNGGHMVLRLALEASELLRGAIVIAASLPTKDNLDCTVSGSPPARLVFVAGAEDPINPYEGGRVTLFGFGDRGSVMSAEASGEWFAQKLGLVSGERRELGDELRRAVTQRDWYGPPGRVRLLTLHEGGHTVPQAGYRFPRIFGTTVMSDAVLESAWSLVTAPEPDPHPPEAGSDTR